MRQECFLERGGSTCRHSESQVSRDQRMRFRGRVDSTMGTIKSSLYIEVSGYISVVMAHVGPAVTKSWEM